MKVAFQIEHPREVTITNSTLVIMEEAQKRGHDIYHFNPNDLLHSHDSLHVMASKLVVDIKSQQFMTIKDRNKTDISEFDIVFIRQDPTFTTNMFGNLFLLGKHKHRTWMINDPHSLLEAPEKLEFFGMEEHCPPTLMANDAGEIEKFWHEHGEIIIKPLFSYGGSGVFYLGKDSKNLRVTVETLFQLHKSALVAQAFLPQVCETGDKRVLLIFGEIAGAYSQTPKDRNIRANICSGGTQIPCDLTTAEKEISLKLAAILYEKGIYIAGLDLIGGYMTEVNVITPGGFFAMREIYNQFPEVMLWDKIEAHPKLR
ncbi:MAG: hypothetical protein AABY33_00485 [Pseudomonadota bacterium]